MRGKSVCLIDQIVLDLHLHLAHSHKLRHGLGLIERRVTAANLRAEFNFLLSKESIGVHQAGLVRRKAK